jgi:hypothetical protein
MSEASPSPGAQSPNLVFVGGTGRSGTHVIARLLGQHSDYEMIPIECRFHCNPSGLADVVTGRATPEQFLDKLRSFWWHRVRHGERAWVRLAPFARRGGQVRGPHNSGARHRF